MTFQDEEIFQVQTRTRQESRVGRETQREANDFRVAHLSDEGFRDWTFAEEVLPQQCSAAAHALFEFLEAREFTDEAKERLFVAGARSAD
jgi:hypothetical protein